MSEYDEIYPGTIPQVVGWCGMTILWYREYGDCVPKNFDREDAIEPNVVGYREKCTHPMSRQ
jgi:hypothetical protein